MLRRPFLYIIHISMENQQDCNSVNFYSDLKSGIVEVKTMISHTGKKNKIEGNYFDYSQQQQQKKSLMFY